MSFRFDSFCGLYCGACDTLIANMENKVNELAKNLGRTSEDVTCHGCKTTVNSVHCRKCELKRCAKDRKIEFCCECPEYPCQRLIDFRHDKYSHHSVVIKNLDFIKKHGVEYWLREQKSRWSCPECGLNFSWYSEKCGNCGSKLFNCIDEEANLEK
ncbi:MAG: hypothetical protein PWR06_2017 [Thermoanaerobacteraceae bacterium]|nr:hypothetical protein [Thermoanaerobacteraceae bacterium]